MTFQEFTTHPFVNDFHYIRKLLDENRRQRKEFQYMKEEIENVNEGSKHMKEEIENLKKGSKMQLILLILFLFSFLSLGYYTVLTTRAITDSELNLTRAEFKRKLNQTRVKHKRELIQSRAITDFELNRTRTEF